MSDEFKTSFLTYYIRSLGERTREEKSGTKFGFDWVIYNLGLAAGWTPQRLPFLRAGASETSTTKTEPEFGIDLAFLSQDRKSLYIFVLKDEILNNRHWGDNGFGIDLRNAASPDLRGADTTAVESVAVILAYNKDEDRAGVTLFENLARAMGTRIGDSVTLTFERWNLTTIVEKVQTFLLTPSLLPQKFFSHFSYICAQFADFRHGSDQWTNQLVPNWRRFLQELFAAKSDERCVRLLPVALLILQEHGKGNATAETAWIDLIEWGMLSAWETAAKSTNNNLKSAVLQIWIDFYLKEIERYYGYHSQDLSVRFSLDKPHSGSFVDAIASAVVAHWHAARIGILGVSYLESLPDKTPEQQEKKREALLSASNCMTGLLNGNPSAMRPLIDLHQIELFLTWTTLSQIGREDDVFNWLKTLTDRLLMRRTGHGQLPFIEGHNSLDLVFEYVATGEKPYGFCDTSSVYLMCLMELICSLPPDRCDPLLSTVYNRLVLAQTDDGESLGKFEPIDLMLWIPSLDWGDRVLNKSLSGEGECATVHFGTFGPKSPMSGTELRSGIQRLVAETRAKRPFKYPDGLPPSVVILGCLKHRSPLPPEIWRQMIFSSHSEGETPVAETTDSNA